MALVYYINWIDPKTGFMKREEFRTHAEMRDRERQLREQGITNIVVGHYSSSSRITRLAQRAKASQTPPP